MVNPFKYVSDSFKDEFLVRFSIGSPDGSAMLSLSNDKGRVAQRMLSCDQLADVDKLEQVITSIRFGLAIDQGRGFSCLGKLSPAANETLA